MPVKPLADDQLYAVRATATAARRRRAQVKQDLRRGAIDLAGVLELRDDEAVAQLKVVEVLKCLPRVGDKTAQRIMDRVGIAGNRRLRGLGRHQIAKLQEELQ